MSDAVARYAASPVPFELSDVILYLLARDTVAQGEAYKLLPLASLDDALAPLEQEIRTLGIPIRFRKTGEHNQSKQVLQALPDLTPYQAEVVNPIFAVRLPVADAPHRIAKIRARVGEEQLAILDGMVPKFAERMRALAVAS